MTLTWQAVSGSQLPSALSEHLSDVRRERWQMPGELWDPRTILVSDTDGSTIAAALTTSRPYNAYRKIADVVLHPSLHRDDTARRVAFETVLRAVHDDAVGARRGDRPSPIVLWFEEHPETAPLSDSDRAALATHGFVRDQDPVPSIPSTLPNDARRVHRWSRWQVGDVNGSESASTPAADRTVPYYGQTTDVTCGAVAALTALEGAGLGRFGDNAGENHSHELSFWRQATNLPACEPVGLSVTTARATTGRASELGLPRVILSTEEYVLLEEYADDPLELRLRTQLQQESLREAERLGISVERRWISAEEIRDLVAAGSYVLLLIDLEPLIADPTPHWVLAHDVVTNTEGDVLLVVTDPWVEAGRGESWADTSGAPITLEGIDRITRWGDPEYRGVIVVPRAVSQSASAKSPSSGE